LRGQADRPDARPTRPDTADPADPADPADQCRVCGGSRAGITLLRYFALGR
jgi:hypothetical protein